jgi:valyl-tRNA synthetase
MTLINREIPVIWDDYVEIEFGTGCLKVTSAHDPNDHEIGLRHKLEIIDTINLDGTLNEVCGVPKYVGHGPFCGAQANCEGPGRSRVWKGL